MEVTRLKAEHRWTKLGEEMVLERPSQHGCFREAEHWRAVVVEAQMMEYWEVTHLREVAVEVRMMEQRMAKVLGYWVAGSRWKEEGGHYWMEQVLKVQHSVELVPIVEAMMGLQPVLVLLLLYGGSEFHLQLRQMRQKWLTPGCW